jgi:lipopolysaccharide transport system ATP-binding protein
MSTESPAAAIQLEGVTKSFRKQTVRREYTTLKTELLDLLLRRKSRAPERQSLTALRGVDLVVPRGKTVGIVGRNGSGKSTLLKLITGIYAPTSGKVAVNGRVSALLDLGAGFHPDFSGRENILINGIMLGMTRADLKARMEDIIAFSELGDFVDEPVRTYSSGMYMRLAFAVATHVDPDILIVDEILAVGDEHFSRKSRARMNQFKGEGRTILLVTHDLGTIENWCDLAAWLDGGVVREFGNPREVVAHYREAVRLAEAQQVAFTPSALDESGGALPSLDRGPDKPPPAGLRHVQLVGPSGRHGTLLRAGESCTLEVGVDHDGVPPVVMVELWQESRLLLRVEHELRQASGGAVSLELPSLPLSSGAYRWVTLLLHAGSRGQLARHEMPLEFVGRHHAEGTLELPHAWRPKPPEAARAEAAG